MSAITIYTTYTNLVLSLTKCSTGNILQKGHRNPRPVVRVEVIIPDKSANIVNPLAISVRRRATSRKFAGVKQ